MVPRLLIIGSATAPSSADVVHAASSSDARRELGSTPYDALALCPEDDPELVRWTRIAQPSAVLLAHGAPLTRAELLAWGVDGQLHDEALEAVPALRAERLRRSRLEPDAPIRVMLVDDDPVVRDSLASTLRRREFEVQTAEDAEDALEMMRDWHAHVLLTDLRMPGTSGSDLLASAGRWDADLELVVLTGFPSTEAAVGTLREGASEFLTKPALPEEIAAAVSRAAERRRARLLARERGPQLESPQGLRPSKPLSAREQEVLRFVAWGYSSREAAEKLGISIKTVQTYRERLGQKLGSTRRADFLQYAISIGLKSP